ncbi:LysR family transcriptional regulator [Acetobacter fabarum]|uniref:LysR family transcriptional regulator n=2 Tax=Acetobacter TaxID=434 RepID=A0A5C1YU61_9PROT|nr:MULTISPECIES: LysR family transcriptional regulator [Acetobacteraceae]NLI27580.1 LysR family transcriptional regulator [Acetobacter sp.]QEO18830.1 LysR family transcriptional regulator [Acetobacter vaccinii]MCG4261174.1 LysR family transcriptional regulator [Acetobacter senegalensis]MDN7355467.1 LysR family transcriptional regulator [Acetobacter senegalensis]NHO41876.1 LysR family transcriptional regulator [Acetobacter fabarum]
MLDRLTSMKIFIKVVELGSFAAASQHLTLSPQMVAKHIEALEHHLGARLLHRTTRRQSLTETGRLYCEQCRLVLQAAERADSLAANTLGTPRGTLSVSVPVTFGRTVFLSFIHSFQKRYPEIQVHLSLTDQLVHPTMDGHEAVIRIGELETDLTAVSRPLTAYRRVICAAQTYLEKHGFPGQPEDLMRHECLLYENSGGPVTTWHLSQGSVTRPVTVSGKIISNDSSVLHSAALGGDGILLGYEQALLPDIKSKRLVRLMPRWKVPDRPVHLLYNAGPVMTPKLRVFVTELQEAFQPEASFRR